MRKTKKYLSIIMLVALLLNLIPPLPSPVYAGTINDPGDLGKNLSQGATVTVDGKAFEFHGYWYVSIDNGKTKALDAAVCQDLNPKTGEVGDVYNYVATSKLSAWVTALNGNYTHANNEIKNKKVTLKSSKGTSTRIHIRYLAEACGAYVSSFSTNDKEVYVNTTDLPSANISYDNYTMVGETETFKLTGSGYAAGNRGLSGWSFEIDGSEEASGNNTSSLNETVEYTFNEPGTYTAKLTVVDNVGRENSDTKTITVVSESGTPPQPPDEKPTSGPIADFEMPSSGTVGEEVEITNTSQASSGHTIERAGWNVNPRDYSSNLTKSGGTATFRSEGSYDVKLTVWDDKDRSDNITKTIFIGEPPPPPEPPNKDPKAKIDMPSHCSQGATVDVLNLSTDDGVIVDVDWDIDPKNGVEDNLEDYGGTITFNETGEYTVTLTVEDDDGAEDTDTDSIEVENKPPKAKISIPDEIIQGEDIKIKSRSYDPDGEIVSHVWEITPDGMIGTIEGKEGGTVYFDIAKDYTLKLTVEDEFGLTDTATETITVKPAIPEAFFQWEGSPKQNRKVSYDATKSLGSTRYPIDWSLAQWVFIPPSGVSKDRIKIANSSDLSKRDVIFKEPGTYTVRLAVTNTAGNTSEWYEKTISISPDENPIVDFYVASAALRDPDNNNKAAIELVDNSYSPDGDIISKRVWKYRYDSDNDGSFNDEKWVVLSSSNNPVPTLYAKNVGKYQFELYAEESFGQDTLPQFITGSDLRYANTSSKALEDKKVEVLNQQPVVNFNAITKKKVDIVFTTGEVDSNKIKDLQGKITQHIETNLANANIEYGTIKSVETYSLSTDASNAQQIFSDWRSVEIPTNFNGSFSNVTGGWSIQGNKVYADGGYRPARAWIDPSARAYGTGDSTIEFKWGIRQNANDFVHGEAGFVFRVKDDRNYYVYIMDNHSACGNVRYDGNEVLVKVENGTQKIIASKEFPRFNAGQSHNFKIITEGNNIKIYRDGALKFNYTDVANPHLSGSYGFYVWDQYGAYFEDIAIQSQSKVTLDEILKQPSWRDDALHFIVNISDTKYEEFDDPEKSGVIYSRLLKDEIHYCVMGTNANKSQTESVININDDLGDFVYNSNMDTAMTQIANYIIEQVNAQKGQRANYILLNEDVDYETYYLDNESDPEIQRRWQYSHDPYYFDNTLGKVSFHDQFISAPVTRFDKVGKFDVLFQAKDNPKNDDKFDEYRKWSYMPLDKLELYVHRRPIADFTSKLTPNTSQGSTVTLTEDFEDTSYKFSFSGDWVRSSTRDYSGSYSYRNKNISNSGSSTSQFTVDIPAGATDSKISFRYLVSSERGYDYLDIYIDNTRVVHTSGNGSWESYQKALSAGRHTVKFNYTKDGSESDYDDSGYIDNLTVSYTSSNIVSKYNIALTNQSYDLDHQTEPNKGIVEEKWQWKEALESNWHSGKPSAFLPGKVYLVYLKVKDKEGVWSTPTARVLNTKNENMAPVAQFFVEPNPLPLGTTLTYEDLSYDPDGDNLIAYRWRSQKDGDGNWTNHGSSPPTSFSSLGEYEIELIVQDAKGAWSEPFYQLVAVVAENNQPVADFDISPNPLPLDVTLNYNDKSYDPDGDPIVTRQWQYSKSSGSWYNGNPTDFSGLGLGNYKIRLRVQDQPALSQMSPLWSSWCEKNLTVIAGNEKPVAQFTLSPNPVSADDSITYTDNSYDPEGAGIAEFVWRIEQKDGTLLGEYVNTLPPTVFADTDWGDDGAGEYNVGLRVKDVSPNGISPQLWSDWAWKSLTVIQPLKGSGEITPNPALSGYQVDITVETEGFAEEVKVTLPNDDFFNGDVVTLEPDSSTDNEENIFRGTYLTDAKTPNGAYNATATLRRVTKQPADTVTVPISVAIQGDIYDQFKVRIRYSR